MWNYYTYQEGEVTIVSLSPYLLHSLWTQTSHVLTAQLTCQQVVLLSKLTVTTAYQQLQQIHLFFLFSEFNAMATSIVSYT